MNTPPIKLDEEEKKQTIKKTHTQESWLKRKVFLRREGSQIALIRDLDVLLECFGHENGHETGNKEAKRENLKPEKVEEGKQTQKASLR